MKKKFTAFATFLVLIFSACEPKYDWLTAEEVAAIDAANKESIARVCYISQNDIYFKKDAYENPTIRITDRPGDVKKNVALHYNHLQLAYQNAQNIIEIIDSNDVLITKLSQYTQVKSFGWVPYKNTLFILNGNDLHFFGDPIQVPLLEIPFDILYHPFNRIEDLSISSQGDLAFIVFEFQTNKRYAVVKTISNQEKIVVDDYFGRVSYVRFSGHQQDLCIGFRSSWGDYLEKFIAYSDPLGFPDFTFESNNFYKPMYCSQEKYFFMGYNQSQLFPWTLKVQQMNNDNRTFDVDSLETSAPIDADWAE